MSNKYRKKLITLICQNCGESFQGNARNHRQRYCLKEECRAIQKAKTVEQQREWHKNAKRSDTSSLCAEDKRKAKKYPCKICGKLSVNRYYCPHCLSEMTVIDPFACYGGLVD